ncbi:H-NS histone family protein [Paraburkholderia hospita]|jgi:hypothetical protein|uniref:H-NS histone family protein n=1 Tax=Paraburkholderia hospita TaxID=169430 RepID=UPI0002718BBA|nr:histone family protein nucleoid-structuring protein H-NS [Burkholderia sp. BT03]SKC69152.1 H-NS histone family protein [Paraburkholderia hospita]SKC77456.1 H-NS histone family protein [Paraburkholderia hospita]
MATLESLQAKIAKLQAQAEAIVKKDLSAVIAKIRAIMEKHGFTTADIDAYTGAFAKPRRSSQVAVQSERTLLRAPPSSFCVDGTAHDVA